MSKKERYQKVEFLVDDHDKPSQSFKMTSNDRYKLNSCHVAGVLHNPIAQIKQRGEDIRQDHDDEDLAPDSPMSSSPPKDFDVNIEAQYAPINFDEDELNSSSLASSLSIDSTGNNGYDATPSPSNHKLNAKISRLIRCPICEKPMRTFYCAKCIQKGNFVTIDNAPSAELFSDIRDQSAYRQAQREDARKKKALEDDEMSSSNLEVEMNEQQLLEESLQTKLRTLRKRTEALKNLYEERRDKLMQTRSLVAQAKYQLDSEKKSNKSKKEKIELITKFISSRTASIQKRRDAAIVLIDDLKQYVNRRVYQLTSDVFPIEQLNLLEQSNTFANMETSPLLTFSDGSHHQIEQQTAYSIVEPWLPSNGDYSAYSLWVNDNKDHIPAQASDIAERNPAFRIGAALAYTTQFVRNLAAYMDVILPARIDMNVFSKELLNDPEFTYSVAKLNANVIFLCVSQGIDVSLLNPNRTLKNLMHLFDMNISDLGRRPIIELDNEEVASKIEERLAADLSVMQDDFYDFNKFFEDEEPSDSEWEISDNINPMEMQLATEQSIQQNSYISRLPPLRGLFGSFWTGT